MKFFTSSWRIILLQISLLAVLFSENIFSQTKTFTGATDNNWGEESNWNPIGVPSATDNVIIPAGETCVVEANASCASLTFNNGSAKRLNINAWGITLTVGGNLVVNDSAIVSPGFLGGRLKIGGTAIINGTLIVSASFWGIVEFQNGITNNGTFVSSGSGIYYFNTNNQSINGNPVSFSGGTLGGFTIQGAISVTNNSIVSLTGNLNGDNDNSTFINAANATLNAGGSVMATGKLDATAVGNSVNFSGANQTIKDTTYFNLSVSGSGTKTISSSTNAFYINGNLSVGNGITLNGNNRTINLKGNWTQDGSCTNPGSFIFCGNTIQAVGGQTPITFNNLTVNNSAGVTLSANHTISGSLTLINGNINTSSTSKLTIASTGSITGGSASSFINGPLAKIKNSNGQQTLVFPVGKDGIYRPIDLRVNHSNTTSTTYTAEVFNSAPATRNLPSSLNRVSSARYWNISKTGSANVTSAYVTLYFGSDDGVTNPLDLRIAKQNGSSWTNLGGTVNGSSIVSTTSFTTFSDFVLANVSGGLNPLPVELSSFTGSSKGTDVELKWITQTEVNNYGFEIERYSVDEFAEERWEKIGFVQGFGNTNSTKQYSFVDDKLIPGKYFYRLKQIDTDGSYTYSGKVEIELGEIPSEFALEQNYPNPFNPVTKIKFIIPAGKSSYVNLKVYDILGNIVASLVNEELSAGEHNIEFDGSKLSSGIYYYSLETIDFHSVKKMMLIK